MLICEYRQYVEDGKCKDVSPTCMTWYVVGGACRTCIPGHDLVGRECILNVVTCGINEYLDGNKCKKIPAECKKFDFFFKLCKKCHKGYTSDAGICKRIICPPRKVPSIYGDGCVDVSPLCGDYDLLSGNCLNCKDEDHTPINGVCLGFTSPLVGCQERQRLGFGPCVGA